MIILQILASAPSLSDTDVSEKLKYLWNGLTDSRAIFERFTSDFALRRLFAMLKSVATGHNVQHSARVCTYSSY